MLDRKSDLDGEPALTYDNVHVDIAFRLVTAPKTSLSTND